MRSTKHCAFLSLKRRQTIGAVSEKEFRNITNNFENSEKEKVSCYTEEGGDYIATAESSETIEQTDFRRSTRRRCIKFDICEILNLKRRKLPSLKYTKFIEESNSEMNQSKTTGLPLKKRLRLSLSPAKMPNIEKGDGEMVVIGNDRKMVNESFDDLNNCSILAESTSSSSLEVSKSAANENAADDVSTAEAAASSNVKIKRAKNRRETISANFKLSRHSNPLRTTVCGSLEETFAEIAAKSSQTVLMGIDDTKESVCVDKLVKANGNKSTQDDMSTNSSAIESGQGLTKKFCKEGCAQGLTCKHLQVKVRLCRMQLAANTSSTALKFSSEKDDKSLSKDLEKLPFNTTEIGSSVNQIIEGEITTRDIIENIEEMKIATSKIDKSSFVTYSPPLVDPEFETDDSPDEIEHSFSCIICNSVSKGSLSPKKTNESNCNELFISPSDQTATSSVSIAINDVSKTGKNFTDQLNENFPEGSAQGIEDSMGIEAICDTEQTMSTKTTPIMQDEYINAAKTSIVDSDEIANENKNKNIPTLQLTVENSLPASLPSTANAGLLKSPIHTAINLEDLSSVKITKEASISEDTESTNGSASTKETIIVPKEMQSMEKLMETIQNISPLKSVRRSKRIRERPPPELRINNAEEFDESTRIMQYFVDGELVTDYYSLEQQLRDVKKLENLNQEFVRSNNISYIPIKQNEYIVSVKGLPEYLKFDRCDCKDEGKPACLDNRCLNRVLCIECGDDCTYGDQCMNKRFQKRTYLPCRLFKSDKKGIGVRAEVEMHPDDFIIEYVGEVMTSHMYNQRVRKEYRRLKMQHFYCLGLDGELQVDATLKGNIARFINHSCDPNAICLRWGVGSNSRVGIFCLKTIMPGEEITFDYCCSSMTKPQACYCGTAKCRGYLSEKPPKPKPEADDSNGKENVNESGTESDGSESSSSETAVEITKATRKRKLKPHKLAGPTKRDLAGNESNIGQSNKSINDSKSAKRVKASKSMREDMYVDNTVEYLVEHGIKQKSDTVRFSRVIPHTKHPKTRLKLLRILQNAGNECLRHFLYLRGLCYLHIWMATAEDIEFRTEILQTLGSLPINNRKMLVDSKVSDVIESWLEDAISNQTIKDKGKELLEKWAKIKDFRIPKIQKVEESACAGDESIAVNNQNEEKSRLEQNGSISQGGRYAMQNNNRNTNINRYTKLHDTSNIGSKLDGSDSRNDARTGNRQESVVYRDKSSYDTATRRDHPHPYRYNNNNNNKNDSAYRREPHSYRNDNATRRDSKIYQIATIDSSRPNRTQRENAETSKWPTTFSQRDYGGQGGHGGRKNGAAASSKPLTKEEFRKQFELEYAREEQRTPEEQAAFEAICKFFGIDSNVTRTARVPDGVDINSLAWYNAYDKPIEAPRTFLNRPLPQGNLPTNPVFYVLPKLVEQLPKGWSYAITGDGKIYYYNCVDKKSRWTAPTEYDAVVVNADEMNPEYDDEGLIEVDPVVVGECSADDLKVYKSQLIATRRYRRKVSLVEQRAISPRCEEDRLYNQQELRKYKATKEKIRKRKMQYTQNQLGNSEQQQQLQLQQQHVMSRLENAVIDPQSMSVPEIPIHEYLLSSDEDTGVPLTPLVESIVREPTMSYKELLRKEHFRKQAELYANIKNPRKDLTPLERGIEKIKQMDALQNLLLTFWNHLSKDQQAEEKKQQHNQQLQQQAQQKVQASHAKQNQRKPSSSSGNNGNSSSSGGNSSARSSNNANGNNNKEDASNQEAIVSSTKSIPELDEDSPEADKFRAEVAGIIFELLKQYRWESNSKCRIQSNKDFNYLLRKISHFVLLKEWRVCKGTLRVTESVKSKTANFLHSYMLRRGPAFKMPHEDSHQYKDVPEKFYLSETT